MKRAKIIENGNLNIKNIVVNPNVNDEAILSKMMKKHNPNQLTNIDEVDDLIKLTRAKVDPISFAMAFYLWSTSNVHPIPTGNGYRLKPEDFKVKHDLRSVVKYFEEKIY
jgi:hypothetical protein